MIKILVILLMISTVIVSAPYPKLHILKNFISSCIFSAVIAAMVFSIVNYVITYETSSEITITAQSDKVVVFRGAMVDGKWYWVEELSNNSNWQKTSEKVLVWNPKNQGFGNRSITFSLPGGENRLLGFNSGQEYGTVSINVDDEIFQKDLTGDSIDKTDVAVYLNGNHVVQNSSSNFAYGVAGAFFFAILAICLILFRKYEKNIKMNNFENREIWADCLRAFLIFIIICLHCSCNVFYNFTEPIEDWYNILYVNCLTAFAVPCFFMLSGALLIRRTADIKGTLIKRIPKIYIPLILWSMAYIVIGIVVQGERTNFGKLLLKSFFSPYSSFLWFIYSIIGLYFLLPIITTLVDKIGQKSMVYALILLLFFPGVFHDFQYITNLHTDMPKFAILWPELGLFLWGHYLWQSRNKFISKTKLLLVGAVIGFAITVLGTYYISIRDGEPNNAMFACIGSCGVLIMSSSIFMLFISFEKKLRNLSYMFKKFIYTISNISMGVYFLHVLVITLLGNRVLFGFEFTSNSGNLINMFAGAILYYSVSAMMCFCCCGIPLIGRIFKS